MPVRLGTREARPLLHAVMKTQLIFLHRSCPVPGPGSGVELATNPREDFRIME